MESSEVRTSIWVEEAGSQILRETLPGLPFGSLKIGQRVHHPAMGELVCIGLETSGSGESARVREIKLKLVS